MKTKRDSLRSGRFLLTVLIVLGHGAVSEAAMIQFFPLGSQMKDREIYVLEVVTAEDLEGSGLSEGELEAFQYLSVYLRLGGHFVGLTGDLIRLEDGEYEIIIGDSKKVLLQPRLTLSIAGDSVRLMRYEIWGLSLNVMGDDIDAGCVHRVVPKRPSPNLPYDNSGGVTVIPVRDVHDWVIQDEIGCFGTSSVGCQRQPYVANVDSEPQGAEIWVDGDYTGQRTPATGLGSSFCDGAELVSVVLRKQGWPVCHKVLEVAPNKTVNVSCTLGQE